MGCVQVNFNIAGEVEVTNNGVLIDGLDSNQIAEVLAMFAGKHIRLTISEE